MKITVSLTMSQAIAVRAALSTRYAIVDRYFEAIIEKFDAAIRASSKARRGRK